MRRHVLVVGGGIAGMFAALRLSKDADVTLATKASMLDSNTRYAQGGIAAVMFEDDNVESHIADTLKAGAGRCNVDAVHILCTEGPDRIRDLLHYGVAFDRDGNELARGLEAAHSAARVLHAGGDATGSVIQFALVDALKSANVNIRTNTFLTRLIVEHGVAVGAEFINESGAPTIIHADAVVLATGGAGQTYLYTTNPEIATGDGVAAAFRAGAVIADAEMYQFHPTMFVGEKRFLISEAVRGEGAVLRNFRGERFMLERDVRAELAPRDVVARAIAEEMAMADGEPVVLDATALDAKFLRTRFPNIDQHCKDAGFDWTREPIPVAPAAHFWMGGVATDLWGRTSIPGLFAIGEVACTGVHGANRLASNSLLEGLVFANRAAHAIVNFDLGETSVVDPRNKFGDDSLRKFGDDAVFGSALPDVQRLTWDNVGLVRDDHGLRIAIKQIAQWASHGTAPVTPKEFELANIMCVANLIATAALERKESVGAHFRSDYP